MRSYTINIDNTRVPVYESGTGENVLLLHGYMGSHLSWRHQFDELAKSYRTVAVDWLGWGDSEKNPDLDYSYDTELRRLRQLIQELNLKPLHLVGHDYGGLMSLGYAQRHAEDLLDLTLLNNKAHKTFRPLWVSVFKFMNLLGRVPGWKAIYRALPLAAVHRAMTLPELRRGVMSPEVVENYCGWMKRADGSEYLGKFMADYRVGSKNGLAEGLPHMKTDTLILWGVKDRYLSAGIPRELAQRIPNAELHLYDDAGHFVPEEAPERVLHDLLAFFRRERGARTGVFGQRPVVAAARVSAGGRTRGR